MITLRNLRLEYGQRALFKDVNVTIPAKTRIGLVGSNGAGKTTLLRILASRAQADSGSIDKAKTVSFGYLPQDGLEVSGKTLYDEVESAFTEILQLRAAIEECTHRLETLSAELPEYQQMLERIGECEYALEALDAATLPSRIQTVLHGLGFSENDTHRNTTEFSGGWQMRIALAKLLLSEPSLLLLDEPTNHLDITSQAWLEQYLNRYPGSILIVSHDRAFLDILCQRTFELSQGMLNDFQGNYSYYEQESRRRRQQLLRSYESQQREIAQTQQFIDRFRYKATKAKQVQSRIKALEKIERIEVEAAEQSIAFSFVPAPRSGHTVAKLSGLTKTYGSITVFEDVNLTIERDDRIAIVGVNGSGKTTLMRVLSGTEAFQSGQRELGSKTLISYFAQHQVDELDPKLSVLQTMEAVAPANLGQNLRSILGAFLFQGDDVFKSTAVLSGGERNRLALAKMLIRPVNFLLLDEPTNHLDMRSQEALQTALQKYDGTFAIVSHNRAFVDPIVNKVIEIRKDGITIFPGNVSDYLEHIGLSETQREPRLSSNKQTLNGKEELKSVSKLSPKERRKKRAAVNEALRPLRKKARAWEETIAKLEERKSILEKEMNSPNFFKDAQKAKQGSFEHAKLVNDLESAYESWSEVADAIAVKEALLEEE